MSDRDEYRDSADERDVLNEDREGSASDSRSDATGDARESDADTARRAAAGGTHQRPRPEAVEAELDRDHRGG